MLISLMPTQSKSQAAKWWKITGNDIALMATHAVAGSADGANQNLAHWRWGKGKQFWDVKCSWQNKYKNFEGGDKSAAFPGSKTWLVFLTDGYHLTRTIDRTATLVSIGIAAGSLKRYPKKDIWKVIAKKAILSAIANRIAFNIIYREKY
jgi:hypothetical protein